MVTPSQTHFVFLKKFSKKTLIYIWLVYMLILYLLTFHWTKPLKNFDCNGILTHNHLVLKQRINHLETGQMVVFIMLARIPLRSLRVFFVICLTQPPNNCFLSLRPNSIKKLMVWLWRKNQSCFVGKSCKAVKHNSSLAKHVFFHYFSLNLNV